jgi:hypothetical protein
MTDLHYQQDGTGIEHKYDASEEKVVVRRYVANHKELAEKAQRVRNDGGTKTINDARLVGSLPVEALYAAEQGWTHRGAYKGILSADGETQQKLLAKFVLEPDIKIYMFNSNYRIG